MVDQPLRILCFGAGAIGTYIGGSLALTGQAVTFLEQPEQVALLRKQGLRLHLEDGVHTLPEPRLATSLDEALETNRYDLVIFALKSFDTPAALASLSPYNNDLPPFWCLQNGVDNEPALAAALGEDRVIAGTVTSAVGRQSVGQIILERRRGIGIAAGHPLSQAIARACQLAGLNPRLFARPLDMKWSKLLTNLLVNASAAILGMPPVEILQHPGLFHVEAQQMREALRVMKALDIRVVDLPGTPVRTLAFLMKYIPERITRPLLAAQIAGGRGAKMPSFFIDLHSGRKKTEVDYLNGAVVRHGARAGVFSPVNQRLNEILNHLADGTLPLDSYQRQPEKLLAEFTSLASPR